MHPSEPTPPLRLGSPAQFASVREFFLASGFTDGQVCSALKLDSLSNLGTLKESALDLAKISPSLALLIRIFVLLQLVSRREFEQTIPADILEHLQTLDLIRGFDSKHYYASVFLYPVLGFIV